MADVEVGVEIGGLKLRSPLLIASGTCAYGKELLQIRGLDWEAIGGIVLKGTTLDPRVGNPPPRIAETPSGMLNAIGLENPGVDKVVSEILPQLKDFPTAVIANVAGFSVSEYTEVCRKIGSSDVVSAIELNVSCPNTERGYVEFGRDTGMLSELVSTIREAVKQPIIVKLSPDAHPVVSLARAAMKSGADALSLVNTAKALAIDIHTRKPRLGNVTGGLSGPAIRPIALERVYQVHFALPEAPIIGCGGIRSAEDALEFVIAGASALAVGTGFLIEPNLCSTIVCGIEEYLTANGMNALKQLVGSLDTG